MKAAHITLMGAMLLCAATAARPLSFMPPQEIIPARLMTPGTEVVRNNCSGCHSLDYVTTQPPGKGAQFWRDAANKMIHVYGAPVASDDVEKIATAIVDSESTPQ